MYVNHRRASKFFALMMLAAAIACEVAVQSMGTLVPDSTPVIFTARGETDQRWEAAVTPDASYEVIIEPQDALSESIFVTLTVCQTNFEICLVDDAISSVRTYGDGARLEFIAPDTGIVYIHYVDTSGENGEAAGNFSITVNQIEP
jgi:hypothetical protein